MATVMTGMDSRALSGLRVGSRPGSKRSSRSPSRPASRPASMGHMGIRPKAALGTIGPAEKDLRMLSTRAAQSFQISRFDMFLANRGLVPLWVGFIMLISIALQVVPVVFEELEPDFEEWGRWVWRVLAFVGTVNMLPVWFALKEWRPATPRNGKPTGPLPTVDIVVPCYKEESASIIDTIVACQRIEYSSNRMHCYVLDDGGNDQLRRAVAALRESGLLRFPLTYVRRLSNAGRKAGNLNNWLRQYERSSSEFFIVLDADMQPFPDMLDILIGHYYGLSVDDQERLSFLQAPQWYQNGFAEKKWRDLFNVSEYFFYRVLQPAMSHNNCAVYVGCMALWRRRAIESIGGFIEGYSTEDSVTGCETNRSKIPGRSVNWISKYVMQPVAAGQTPGTLPALFDQRMRWYYGLCQMFYHHNGYLLASGLTFTQRILFWVTSASYIANLVNYTVSMSGTLFLLGGIAYYGFTSTLERITLWAFWVGGVAWLANFTTWIFVPGCTFQQATYAVSTVFIYTPVFVASLLRYHFGIKFHLQGTVVEGNASRRWHPLFVFPIFSCLLVTAASANAAAGLAFSSDPIPWMVAIQIPLWWMLWIFLHHHSIAAMFGYKYKFDHFYEDELRGKKSNVNIQRKMQEYGTNISVYLTSGKGQKLKFAGLTGTQTSPQFSQGSRLCPCQKDNPTSPYSTASTTGKPVLRGKGGHSRGGKVDSDADADDGSLDFDQGSIASTVVSRLSLMLARRAAVEVEMTQEDEQRLARGEIVRTGSVHTRVGFERNLLGRAVNSLSLQAYLSLSSRDNSSNEGRNNVLAHEEDAHIATVGLDELASKPETTDIFDDLVSASSNLSAPFALQDVADDIVIPEMEEVWIDSTSSGSVVNAVVVASGLSERARRNISRSCEPSAQDEVSIDDDPHDSRAEGHTQTMSTVRGMIGHSVMLEDPSGSTHFSTLLAYPFPGIERLSPMIERPPQLRERPSLLTEGPSPPIDRISPLEQWPIAPNEASSLSWRLPSLLSGTRIGDQADELQSESNIDPVTCSACAAPSQAKRSGRAPPLDEEADSYSNLYLLTQQANASSSDDMAGASNIETDEYAHPYFNSAPRGGRLEEHARVDSFDFSGRVGHEHGDPLEASAPFSDMTIRRSGAISRSSVLESEQLSELLVPLKNPESRESALPSYSHDMSQGSSLSPIGEHVRSSGVRMLHGEEDTTRSSSTALEHASGIGHFRGVAVLRRKRFTETDPSFIPVDENEAILLTDAPTLAILAHATVEATDLVSDTPVEATDPVSHDQVDTMADAPDEEINREVDDPVGAIGPVTIAPVGVASPVGEVPAASELFRAFSSLNSVIAIMHGRGDEGNILNNGVQESIDVADENDISAVGGAPSEASEIRAGSSDGVGLSEVESASSLWVSPAIHLTVHAPLARLDPATSDTAGDLLARPGVIDDVDDEVAISDTAGDVLARPGDIDDVDEEVVRGSMLRDEIQTRDSESATVAGMSIFELSRDNHVYETCKNGDACEIAVDEGSREEIIEEVFHVENPDAGITRDRSREKNADSCGLSEVGRSALIDFDDDLNGGTISQRGSRFETDTFAPPGSELGSSVNDLGLARAVSGEPFVESPAESVPLSSKRLMRNVDTVSSESHLMTTRFGSSATSMAPIAAATSPRPVASAPSNDVMGATRRDQSRGNYDSVETVILVESVLRDNLTDLTREGDSKYASIVNIGGTEELKSDSRRRSETPKERKQQSRPRSTIASFPSSRHDDGFAVHPGAAHDAATESRHASAKRTKVSICPKVTKAVISEGTMSDEETVDFSRRRASNRSDLPWKRSRSLSDARSIVLARNQSHGKLERRPRRGEASAASRQERARDNNATHWVAPILEERQSQAFSRRDDVALERKTMLSRRRSGGKTRREGVAATLAATVVSGASTAVGSAETPVSQCRRGNRGSRHHRAGSVPLLIEDKAFFAGGSVRRDQRRKRPVAKRLGSFTAALIATEDRDFRSTVTVPSRTSSSDGQDIDRMKSKNAFPIPKRRSKRSSSETKNSKSSEKIFPKPYDSEAVGSMAEAAAAKEAAAAAYCSESE